MRYVEQVFGQFWYALSHGWVGLALDWLLTGLLPLVALWAVAYVIVRRHLQSLAEREAGPRVPVATVDTLPNGTALADGGRLLVSNVVLAHSAVRVFLVHMRKIFGGRIKVLERLMDRARREALLRLEEEARIQGFDAVINVRIDASAMGSSLSCEVIAYGTGVRLAASDESRAGEGAFDRLWSGQRSAG